MLILSVTIAATGNISTCLFNAIPSFTVLLKFVFIELRNSFYQLFRNVYPFLRIDKIKNKFNFQHYLDLDQKGQKRTINLCKSSLIEKKVTPSKDKHYWLKR